MKQITVFGATGKVGSGVVEWLLKDGKMVVAFVHGGHYFENHPNLRIVTGDIYNSKQVAQAISGSDAIVSALGSWGTPRMDILSSGMRNIIPAMEHLGVHRIVTLTGADARDISDQQNKVQKLMHWFFRRVASKIMADSELHIRLLRQSTLDFTVLRSPVMTNGGRKGSYVLRNRLPKLNELTVARDDVAAAMVELIETTEFSRQSPVIYRR